MQDQLEIIGLTVLTHIGVYAWEQRIRQTLRLDLTIPMNTALTNDTLASTLDYDALCQCVTQFIEDQSFQLIETVAENVADLILTTFHVPHVHVCVTKPHAIKNAEHVRVSIHRPRMAAHPS